nr:cytosine permease [Bacillus velezensis]
MAGLGESRRRLEYIRASSAGFLSFIFFWGIHLLVLRHGMESIKKFEVWAGPLVYLVFGGMVWWAIDIAGGLGPIYSQPESSIHFLKRFGRLPPE